MKLKVGVVTSQSYYNALKVFALFTIKTALARSRHSTKKYKTTLNKISIKKISTHTYQLLQNNMAPETIRTLLSL